MSVIFSWYFAFSSTNKTDRHDITEILLQVVFNTITITKAPYQLKKPTWCVINVLCYNYIPVLFFTPVAMYASLGISSVIVFNDSATDFQLDVSTFCDLSPTFPTNLSTHLDVVLEFIGILFFWCSNLLPSVCDKICSMYFLYPP